MTERKQNKIDKSDNAPGSEPNDQETQKPLEIQDRLKTIEVDKLSQGQQEKHRLKSTEIAAYKKILKLMEDFERVEAKGRNFTVEIIREADNNRIILKGQSGSEDLSSYLPPKNKFADGGEFKYRASQRLVFFDAGMIPTRGFILSLFHEIGHARQGREHKSGILKNLGACAESFFILAYKYLKGELKGVKPVVGFLDIDNLPSIFSERWVSKRAKSERNAWAFALNTLRSLERKGFNVFAGFNSLDEIRLFVDGFILIYEMVMNMENKEGNTRFVHGSPKFLKNIKSLGGQKTT